MTLIGELMNDNDEDTSDVTGASRFINKILITIGRVALVLNDVVAGRLKENILGSAILLPPDFDLQGCTSSRVASRGVIMSSETR